MTMNRLFGGAACQCSGFPDFHTRHSSTCDAERRPQRRARARVVRRRIVLVRGDLALAGKRPERHLGAEPADHLAGSRRLSAARSGSARWADRLRRAFLLRHDPHGGRRAREGLGPGLCRGPGPGRGGGLYGAGQGLSDPASKRRNRLRWRRGPAHRSGLPPRFAGDLPEPKAKLLYAVQEPFHKALLTGKTTHAAWHSKPSYYAVSTEDRNHQPGSAAVHG